MQTAGFVFLNNVFLLKNKKTVPAVKKFLSVKDSMKKAKPGTFCRSEVMHFYEEQTENVKKHWENERKKRSCNPVLVYWVSSLHLIKKIPNAFSHC